MQVCIYIKPCTSVCLFVYSRNGFFRINQGPASWLTLNFYTECHFVCAVIVAFCLLVEGEATQAPAIECCACGTAKYRLTFYGNWSEKVHPKDYPSEFSFSTSSDWCIHVHSALWYLEMFCRSAWKMYKSIVRWQRDDRNGKKTVW